MKQNEQETPKTEIAPHIGIIAVGILIIFALWVISGVLIWRLFPVHQDRGTFGDMFGAINALFSGLALAGVIYAIILQRQELRHQLQELKISVQAQNKQADSLSKAIIYQSISDVTKEYRSPQMLHAVNTLWGLYMDFGSENLVQNYEELRKEDDARISYLSPEQRIEAVQGTLHYQRRLVSQFYQSLARIYIEGILPKEIIYSTWSEPDLRIIPTILVPIENKLREVLHDPPVKPLDDNSSLMKLYNDSRTTV